MSFSGDVEFTILDGAAGVFTGPTASVQVVIGCSTGGTVATASNAAVVATRSLQTLVSNFTGGPLVEAAGMVINAGGTVLAIKATTATAGVILGTAQATTAISGVAIVDVNARITYVAQTPHVLQAGDVVTIAAVGGATEVNGTWKITAIVDATHFEIGVTSITPYTSGGTVEWTGAITGGGAAGAIGASAGTAAPFFTGTPTDSMNIQVVAQTGFTVGTTGGTVIVSYDGGRNYGSPIAVGTSTTLLLADTGGASSGVTIDLGGSGKTWTGGGVSAGVPVGDYARCTTTEPLPNAAGIGVAIGALRAYLAGSGAGFQYIQITGIWAGSDVTTLTSGGSYNLNGLASAYIFTRMIMSARDASPPSAWGGTGETESTWSASVLADFQAIVSRRACGTAGFYNMPSAFPTQIAGTPAYRRPFSFALGARVVAVPVQVLASKVGQTNGGSLTQIVVSPRDSTDGWIYHNEAVNPAFNYLLPGGQGRMASARTHERKPGIFADLPLLLAPAGSDFFVLSRGGVMDVACSIAHDALVDFSSAELTTKANGTLSDSGAASVYNAVYTPTSALMLAAGMISGFTVVVDQTQNIQVTKKLQVTISILGVVYILEVDVTIGYANSLPGA